MVDGVSTSNSPRYLEMNRDYGSEPDGGKNLELAMGATIFRDLQKAGYIDPNAKLSDHPPGAGNVNGKSYEARLVQLIKDRDGNGKLDIDLDALRGSGMLQGSPTTDQLEGALSGKPRERLSDSFINGQSDKSGLSWHGLPMDKGKKVQAYSNGMVLNNTQDRQTDAVLSGAADRAAKSPDEAKALANSAITNAQVLAGRGDQNNARRLLSGTGQALQDAGRLDDAAKVYKQLQKDPYAKVPLNLAQDLVDRTVGRGNATEVPDNKTLELARSDGKGNVSDIKLSDFKSTYGDLATHHLAQIDQTKQMQATLGRSVDPHNVDDAREYFNAYAKGKPTDQVRGEYERYLKNFYTHSGEGVTWDKEVPEADRPNQLNDLFGAQDQDLKGRTIIDCEGYSYLTDHVMGGIKNADGSPRFNVDYAEKQTHVITGVFENHAQKGQPLQGFSVNNSSTKMFSGPITKDAQRRQALSDELFSGAGRVSYAVGFGSDQAAAQPVERPSPNSPAVRPRVGQYIRTPDGQLLQVTPKVIEKLYPSN
jgi:hypothetical protein